MRQKKLSTPAKSVRPRLRVMWGEDVALGPGRVDLLEQIAQTGSLRAAASSMGMSYMRAWGLAKDLNRWFRTPLVRPTRGGRTGGGAELTPAGRAAVAHYRAMEKQCQVAMRGSWKNLRSLLKR
jgi:molybdate transport system regulatory protein